MQSPGRGWILFATAGVLAAAADLLTKSWAFARLGMPGTGGRIGLVEGILDLETNLNEGALFGMGQGFGGFFAVVSAAALVGIGIMVARAADEAWLPLALGLIAGGIVGNLYDRLGLPGLHWHAPLERRGEPVFAVRDWIHFAIEGVIDWPIFNLADASLVVGAAMLMLLAVRKPDVGQNHG